MKKTEFAKFRISPEEREALRLAAKKEGVGVSKYIRRCLRAAGKKNHPTVEPRPIYNETIVLSGIVREAPKIRPDAEGKERIIIKLDLSRSQPTLPAGNGNFVNVVVYYYDTQAFENISQWDYIIGTGLITESNATGVIFIADKIQVKGGLISMVSGIITTEPVMIRNNLSFVLSLDDTTDKTIEVMIPKTTHFENIAKGCFVKLEGKPFASHNHTYGIYVNKIEQI